MAGLGVVIFGFLGFFAFAEAYKCRDSRVFFMIIGFSCWAIALFLQSRIGY